MLIYFPFSPYKQHVTSVKALHGVVFHLAMFWSNHILGWCHRRKWRVDTPWLSSGEAPSWCTDRKGMLYKITFFYHLAKYGRPKWFCDKKN